MKAITREEKIISGENLTPITRKEKFLAKASGMDVETPKPITREEMFLSKISGGGSGVLISNSETPNKSTTIAECEDLRISFPNATSVGEYAFFGCTSLASIDLPNVTSVSSYAFNGCTALTSIDLPNVTGVGIFAFEDCTALTSIDLPNVTDVGSNAFEDCTALTSIDLPNVTDVGGGAFYGCASLDALILRNTETVCNLVVTALFDTKILTAEGMPTGEGFVYVPTALYEQYVASLVEQVMLGGHDEATATYLVTAVLRKIEDYPEIVGVSE